MTQRTCEVDACEKVHLARGLCRLHWKRQYGKPTRYQIVCQICGSESMSSRKDGKFCSDSCKAAAYRSTRALVTTTGGMCKLPINHHAMRLMNPPTPKRVRPYLTLIVAGKCLWCGSAFCALTAGGPARYCSSRCQRAAGKARREKLKGQFYISPVLRRSIYERDGWVCQLCFEPVDQALAGSSHDWAPSLDHIECQSWSLVPDHGAHNLRLTHRWCNAVRGAGNHADFFASLAA